ncbi:peptidoglycan endopeptidase [Sphingorhabdus pulchriflava]|uniref:Peptidoglycan endopeptidase n=1 Tax=Sphingorhabdus pulchriflava TaxID=2292257 RepID=A0A371BER2_9SPHN|nr:peptidoglycan endopeptidase [Sphingorhabdus pulchriflava]RDV06089.1 peptidoglycan endopeptidase [Sphingorhabdus pulchriflava]
MEHGPQEIASRVLSQLGVPFRLHGRAKGVSLDCVGLVAIAIESYLDGRSVPQNYSMRGDFLNKVSDFFAALPFESQADGSATAAGDILLAEVGPSQLHLVVVTEDGWVHAHAGLRRVVRSTPQKDWEIIRHWRLNGE